MANGGKIPKDKAIKWVKKYKDKHADSTHSIVYDKTLIQELLEIDGCETIRIHFAENDDGTNCMVLVAVDKDGNAILPPDSGATSAFIVEDGTTCPPKCNGGAL